MKCYICDKTLANDEIKFEPEYERGGFAPCGTCTTAAEEVFEPYNEEEIDRQLAVELYYEGLQDDNDTSNTPLEETS